MERPTEQRTTLRVDAATELERVVALRDQFESHRTIAPIYGSVCWEDRRIAHIGERPVATAGTKLAVALDHALMLRQLVVEDRLLPIWSHYTLARPILEASVQARWLMDPTVTTEVRIGRAVGAALEDLDWSRKVTDELAAGGLMAPTTKSADRAAEVAKQAKDANIAPIQMLDTTSLLGRYGLFPNQADSILWRYLSGVLHMQMWAALQGSTKHYSGDAHSFQHHEADDDMSANAVVASIKHLAEAVMAHSAYLEPQR
jgi:hypothetical protein